jgi:drug/metabolite transporter (DMT)-like permease
LLPVVLLTGEVWLPQTTHGWSVLIGLALISHAGGQSLIAYALAHLPAAFSTVALSLQPAVAAWLAWVVLGEALSAGALAGAALLLVGIWLAGRASRL